MASLISADRVPASFEQDLLCNGERLWFRCKDCGSTWVGGDGERITVKHARSCASKAQVAPEVAPVPVQKEVNLVAAAKRGDFHRHADTDELVYLVQNGLVSPGTAMNQDF